jgi:hypothetical protein
LFCFSKVLADRITACRIFRRSGFFRRKPEIRTIVPFFDRRGRSRTDCLFEITEPSAQCAISLLIDCRCSLAFAAGKMTPDDDDNPLNLWIPVDAILNMVSCDLVGYVAERLHKVKHVALRYLTDEMGWKYLKL